VNDVLDWYQPAVDSAGRVTAEDMIDEAPAVLQPWLLAEMNLNAVQSNVP
jgi:hypothetical protein